MKKKIYYMIFPPYRFLLEGDTLVVLTVVTVLVVRTILVVDVLGALVGIIVVCYLRYNNTFIFMYLVRMDVKTE